MSDVPWSCFRFRDLNEMTQLPTKVDAWVTVCNLSIRKARQLKVNIVCRRSHSMNSSVPYFLNLLLNLFSHFRNASPCAWTATWTRGTSCRGPMGTASSASGVTCNNSNSLLSSSFFLCSSASFQFSLPSFLFGFAGWLQVKWSDAEFLTLVLSFFFFISW